MYSGYKESERNIEMIVLEHMIPVEEGKMIQLITYKNKKTAHLLMKKKTS